MLKLKRKHELIILVIIGAALGLIFISKLSVFKSIDAGPGKPNKDTVNITDKKESLEIYVYITGEIKKPGVYILKTGDRVSDLMTACGGFTENADHEGVNMAEKLKDEQHITVPQRIEQSLDGAKRSAIVSGKININIATAEEIDSFLPGIGSTLAKSIIDHREKNGRFKSVDDVANVNGIGSGKRFEKIKELITVN